MNHGASNSRTTISGISVAQKVSTEKNMKFFSENNFLLNMDDENPETGHSVVWYFVEVDNSHSKDFTCESSDHH